MDWRETRALTPSAIEHAADRRMAVQIDQAGQNDPAGGARTPHRKHLDQASDTPYPKR